MPRTALLAAALSCLACSGTDNSGKAEPTQVAAKPEPEPKPKSEAQPEPEPPTADGVSEAAEPDALAPPPAWFDPGAFEHAAIVRQDMSASRLPSGKSASMIVLELVAGTTAEQCIETARAKLGESIPELPATTNTPQGYLELRGQTDAYEYTVVCGVAKDKPTMFLSYLH
jgi:hypothetical protein